MILLRLKKFSYHHMLSERLFHDSVPTADRNNIHSHFSSLSPKSCKSSNIGIKNIYWIKDLEKKKDFLVHSFCGVYSELWQNTVRFFTLNCPRVIWRIFVRWNVGRIARNFTIRPKIFAIVTIDDLMTWSPPFLRFWWIL